MTDEQIKKALEYCCGSIQNDCRDCPFGERCENDESLLKYSLDLINRKDAEIERLNNELVSADEVIGFREAEIERLQEVTTNTVNSSIRFGLDKEQEIRKAKSEAYKEFAERLHQNCKKYRYTIPYVLANIEITYKELTEGGNEDGISKITNE